MNSTPQEPTTGPGSDFLSFSANEPNDGNNRNYRQYGGNNRHNPYNNQWNRNSNFRNRNQSFNNDMQFAPPNFSSPVGGHQQRFNNGGFQPRNNYSNNFRNRNRNFTPQKRPNSGHQKSNDLPIQQYFHKSMLEDPWTDCHRFMPGGSGEPLNVPLADKTTDADEQIIEEEEEHNDNDNDENIDAAVDVNNDDKLIED